MSAAEFRAAFQRETDRYLARLGDDARGARRGGPTGRRRREDGPERPGAEESVSDSAVVQLRALAASLAEGSVQRAEELAAGRERGAGSPASACSAAGGAAARQEAAAELEAECQRLEAELLQRREAQVRWRGELLEKLAAAHAGAAGRLGSAALGAREDPERASAEPGPGPDGHAERLDSVRAQLQAAGALAGGLCTRKAGIEKVEAWQSRSPCAAEAALANAASGDVRMHEEDVPFQDPGLFEGIRKGGRIRRRLSSHFAGA